jgi:predicted NBD/HSP70 family sugar kinase
LRLIYEQRARTRFELAQETGLSRSAATLRVDALLRTGLLVEDGATATAGRRATNFSFNMGAGCILAADIGVNRTKTTVTDLAGRPLAVLEDEIDIARGPSEVLGRVKARFREHIADTGFAPDDVWGIGIAAPGPVEFATGKPIEPPTMPGWDDFDIRGWFRSAYACPVIVDQDTNVMALGEQRASWRDADPFLLVRIDYGIGAGIVTGGTIYRGAQGAAGDIGHLRLRGYKEMPCRCGNVGCVEAAAGGWALIRDLNAEGFSLSSTEDLIRLLSSGNVEAARHLRSAGRVLGEAVAAAVNILNPSVVAIGGPLAHIQADLLAGIRETLYQRSLPLATRHLHVVTASRDETIQVAGMAMLVADHVTSARGLDERLAKRTEPTLRNTAVPGALE